MGFKIKYHRFFDFFYRSSVLLSAILGVFLLFQEKSEVNTVGLFGYSWRKILLVSLILIVSLSIILISSFFNESDPKKSLFILKIRLFFDNSIVRKAVKYFLLLIGIFLLIFLLFIGLNPANNIAIVQTKILGFYLFILINSFLIFSRICYLEIIHEKLPGLQTIFLSVVTNKNTLYKYVCFVIFYALFTFMIYKKLLQTTTDNTAFPDEIMIWVFFLLIGLFILDNLNDKQFLEKIKSFWESDKRYYFLFLFFLSFILLFGHVAFQVNDDFDMMTIAAGWIDGIPDAHLVFTNVIIGTVLKALYIFAPSLNWYAFYLLVFLSISGFTMLNVILHFGKNVRTIAILIFSISYLSFYFNFSFTSVSILVSLSGFGYLFKVIDGGNKKQFVGILFSIVLIVAGGLIRFHSLLLVFILTTPLFFYKTFYRKQYSLIVALCSVLFLTTVTFLIDKNAYASDTEWKIFQEYNKERGNIHATPRTMSNQIDDAYWDSIGWKKTGFELFRNWIFIDKDVFTLESFKKVNKDYALIVNNIGTITSILYGDIEGDLCEFLATILFILYIIPKLNLIIHKNKSFLFMLFFVPIIIIMMTTFLRMPPYIFGPVLFYLNSILVVFISKNVEVEDTLWLNFGNLVKFLSLLLVFQLVLTAKADQTNKNNNDNFNLMVYFVSEKIDIESNPLVIRQSGFVPVQWASPFRIQKLPFTTLPTGWLINSPPYQHLLLDYEIENPVESLLDRPDIYLLGTAEEILINYLAEVKGIDARVITSEEIPLNYYSSNHVNLVTLGIGK